MMQKDEIRISNEAMHQLSQTATSLKRSVMRELMALAVSPDIISLAGGLPANDCLPVQALQACIDHVLRRDGYRALQYGPQYMPLREWLAGYMNRKGVGCTPENIFITNGAQHGLAILSRLYADPGDTAVVEAVTFTGVQQVTAGRRLKVRTVPTHLTSGVDVEALERAFRKAPKPKFAILIPNFHNPLGVSISLEKRERIVRLAREFQIPIVEDDPYSPLRFEGEVLPFLKAFDQNDQVIYLGSFSKMLAPALRLGWIVAPDALASRIIVLRESLDLESSQLIQRAVTEFLMRGQLEPHLENLNKTNLVRKNVLMAALESEFAVPGASWTKPEGGLFAWVTLPEKYDAREIFKAAVSKKVAYIPGSAFAVEGGYRNTMRLNFSNATEGNIRQAVRRLAQVIRENG
jgi:2-aminoadipate transaminase